MHLRKLRITNFRGLENIEADFDSLVSVIIGPNAIGKTTVLEAIRLTKALLAPRTQSEGTQTLQKIGLSSPHLPQRIFSAALTNNPGQPTAVRCSFKAEQDEITAIEQALPRLAPNLALQSIGLPFGNAAQAMGFLGSPQGLSAVKQAQAQLAQEFGRFKASGHLELNLTIDYRSGSVAGEHPTQHLFYTALEQGLDPARTMFSYFPADRALPIGETQPVMIGLQDSLQQLESYNSQPELKSNRLKQTIYNSIIGGAEGRDELTKQFNLIFERILKGRELGPIGLNQVGSLSIQIIDKDSKSTFDVDGLSSGEKGLILTCLVIARSVAHNGLILLDEPELHLNPAVCRDLLQFLVDEYAIRKNMQAIVCSHSAEILAGTFERPSRLYAPFDRSAAQITAFG
jgi:predicted ATPase